VELAILAIPAGHCLGVVEYLIEHKGTRAFIIISAGFGEVDEAGRQLESKLTEAVDRVDGCLIGPNCIGVLNRHYHGVFTTPIPELSQDGCDLVSSSGATAVFVMEAAMPLGLRFCNVFSVGNAIQTSVEDVLEYLDQSYEPGDSSRIKLLYMETVSDSAKFLRHASSLVKKGCKLAAIKAGATDAGSRAAASHTGALASSDLAIRAMFTKAGVVYCSSREELITVASVFNYRPLTGKNIAIITHAGGSAVMLADALTRAGLDVPPIEGPKADELLSHLYPGSAVGNPIDFLATGTADQLGIIIDYCEHKFDHIDAMVVVFGSPGLFDVENVYRVLSVKLDVCKKPILPVLPSVINAQTEIKHFLARGHINFPDEVVLGRALGEAYNTPAPSDGDSSDLDIDEPAVRQIIEAATDGFLDSAGVEGLLQTIGIPQVEELAASSVTEALQAAGSLEYPLAIKVVGPLHKSDVGGVALHVGSDDQVASTVERLLALEGATGVAMQPMIQGVELFIGAVKDPKMGHLILLGLGGVLVEVIGDVQAGLVPLDRSEIRLMLHRLKGYQLFEGVRGQSGVSEELFCDLVLRVSRLLQIAPEITELDLNPLIGRGRTILTVDARVNIQH
jgi:acetyltransferase